MDIDASDLDPRRGQATIPICEVLRNRQAEKCSPVRTTELTGYGLMAGSMYPMADAYRRALQLQAL